VSHQEAEPPSVIAKGRKRNAVPLEIEAELADRGVSGRISVIVEGMPVGAALSAGTNNWDKTWSLSAEDLDGLQFLPPDGGDGEYVLAVRVLRFDDDGFEVANTVALFDMAVRAPKAESGATDARRIEQERLAAATAEWEAAAAKRLAEAKAKWDEDAKQSLAAAVKEWERETARQFDAAKKKWDAEAEKRLRSGEAQWKAAESERVAAAKTSWSEEEARQLASLEATWQAELKARTSDLKAEWQAAAQKRLAGEKAAWQKEEESRMAAEKAAWEKQAGERLAAAKESWEPLAEQRMAMAKADWEAKQEQKLSEAKARWRAEEEKQLAKARAEWESGRPKREGAGLAAQPASNVDDALAAARSVWEAEAQQRLSEAESQWRAEVERRIGEIQAAFDGEARERLKKAEERWKADEAARLDAARAAWQADSEGNTQVYGKIPLTQASEAEAIPGSELEPEPVPAAAKASGETAPTVDTRWMAAYADEALNEREPDPEWQREANARRAAADAKKEIEVSKKKIEARRKKAKIEIWSKTEERHRRTTAQVKRRIAGPRSNRWRAVAAVFCVLLAAAGTVQLVRMNAESKVVLDRVLTGSAEADRNLLYVRVDAAIVRAEAAPESAILDNLPRDTAVRELQRRGDWVQIAAPESGKPLGWMRATLLRTDLAVKP